MWRIGEVFDEMINAFASGHRINDNELYNEAATSLDYFILCFLDSLSLSIAQCQYKLVSVD